MNLSRRKNKAAPLPKTLRERVWKGSRRDTIRQGECGSILEWAAGNAKGESVERQPWDTITRGECGSILEWAAGNAKGESVERQPIVANY